MNGRPNRVLFVVPDMNIGAAERHVVTMLPRMDSPRFAPSVVCIGEEADLVAGASRLVTSGCALKPVRDDFDVDVIWRKFDRLHREVGR